MKIGLLAPLYTLGKDGQGGIGTFVCLLVKELVKRGHTVDLLTVGSSKISGNKIALYDQGIFDQELTGYQITSREIAGSILAEDYLNLHDYDVVHNNKVDFYAYAFLAARQNVLTTFHQQQDSPGLAIATEIRPETNRNRYVAISNSQASSIDLNFIETVYNGIDLNELEYSSTGGDHFVWMARVEPEKGIEEAITLADKAQVPFKFAGSKREESYYHKILELAKSKNIEFLGYADKALKKDLFANARALLFPLQWDEPFGLIFIEAMASGTPVITYDRGAASEIIIDGVTGFVCPPNDEAAMLEAIKKIQAMPEAEYQAMRTACRQRVEEHFTIEKMVDRYESLYNKITQQSIA